MSQLFHRWKPLVERFPIGFAAVYFVISFSLQLAITLLGRRLGAILAAGFVDLILQSLLALSVLNWLRWRRAAGFNSPTQWRDMFVLWLPLLLALFYLSPLAAIPISSPRVLALAALYALLTGLNEEAGYRGVLLQALLPYGPRAAVILSAVFFGLAHLNNLLVFGSSALVFAQAIGTFLIGVGFAACRLRTNTLWPLILIHACFDLATDLALFQSNVAGTHATTGTFSPGLIAAVLIIPGLLLATYGLLILRRFAPERATISPSAAR